MKRHSLWPTLLAVCVLFAGVLLCVCIFFGRAYAQAQAARARAEEMAARAAQLEAATRNGEAAAPSQIPERWAPMSSVTSPITLQAADGNLEVAPRQVMFEVLIMEIDAPKLQARKFDLARELGVENRPQPDPQTRSPIVATLSQREFRLLTSGLKLAEAVKVIARPSVVTIDGHTSTVHSGGELPLLKIERTVNGKRTTSVDARPFGTIVEITPHVTSADALRCDVTAESSRLVDEKGELPRLISRKMQVSGQLKFGQVLIAAEPEEFAIGEGEKPPSEPLTLVAITPARLDSDEMGGSAQTLSGPAVSGLLGEATQDEAAPEGETAHDEANVAAPENERKALPRKARGANALRAFELKVPRAAMAELEAALKTGARIRRIDLLGRQRGAKEDEIGLEEVLQDVRITQLRISPGHATLIIPLSQRDADRLTVAQRHCEIIPVPVWGEWADGEEDAETKGEVPASRVYEDPFDESMAEPSDDGGAGLRPKSPALRPLRTELKSLRDEVRGLHDDVQRILELLQEGGDVSAHQGDEEAGFELGGGSESAFDRESSDGADTDFGDETGSGGSSTESSEAET